MYTFYFQYFGFSEYYTFAAVKGPSIPEGPGWPKLGKMYDDLLLMALADEGYRVVIVPQFPELHADTDQMFYATGYRGPDSPKLIDVEKEQSHEYLKFINYGNGSDINWEDYPAPAQDMCQEDPNLHNPKTDTPGIGPLPPQAPLAPTPSQPWHSDLKPWEPADGIVEDGQVVATPAVPQPKNDDGFDPDAPWPEGPAMEAWKRKGVPVTVPAKPTDNEIRAYQELRQIILGPVQLVPADEYLAWKESEALKIANAGAAVVQEAWSQVPKPSLSLWESIKECFRW